MEDIITTFLEDMEDAINDLDDGEYPEVKKLARFLFEKVDSAVVSGGLQDLASLIDEGSEDEDIMARMKHWGHA